MSCCFPTRLDRRRQRTQRRGLRVGDTGQKCAATTVSPAADAISVQTGANSVFDVDGYIFTPSAQVGVSGASTASPLADEQGVTASYSRCRTRRRHRVRTGSSASSPSRSSARSACRRSRNVDGRQVRSTSRLEVNVDRSFAINSWTVDA